MAKKMINLNAIETSRCWSFGLGQNSVAFHAEDVRREISRNFRMSKVSDFRVVMAEALGAPSKVLLFQLNLTAPTHEPNDSLSCETGEQERDRHKS